MYDIINMVNRMKKRGFASMYMVYSFFIIFIMMMLSVLLINNYKKSFLNALKNDIKEEISTYHIEIKEIENFEEDLLDTLN